MAHQHYLDVVDLLFLKFWWANAQVKLNSTPSLEEVPDHALEPHNFRDLVRVVVPSINHLRLAWLYSFS